MILLCRSEVTMAIGEAGSITTNSPTENQLITVTLTEPLTNPVFALSATNNGGDPFVLRVVSQTTNGDGDTTSFSFIIEEWEYLDGPHPAVETINWLAVEAGVHTLPDGRIIEAGTSDIASTGRNTGDSVEFQANFTAPPVVLTSVMSENDTTTVDSDPSGITASGFNLTLQEEEAQNSIHASETIGWIAIQAGGDGTSGTANAFGGVDENTDILSLGATFTNGVVLAETQTINGGDTATVVIDGQTGNTVGVFIEEEQSQNEETNHLDETVGIVAFEDGLIPCFTAGTRIATPDGLRLIEDLAVGDLVETADQGPMPLRWIGRRRVAGPELAQNPNLLPVRISAGALGHHLPARDLLVSRQHRILVASRVAERMFGASEVLIAAVMLVPLPGIYIDRSVGEIDYIHLLFDGHELVFAEGTRSESLYFGAETERAMTQAGRAEIAQLFPELTDAAGRVAPARHIPIGRRQKRFVSRISKNNRAILET